MENPLSQPEETQPNPPAEGIAGMRPRLPLWKRIGGDGLIVSVVFHGILLFIFAAWVIVTITDEAKTDPETFATGSGGGAKGERAKVYEHKMTPRNAQNLARTSARITSKSATASVALPDLPTTAAPSLMAGLSGGGSSKGFGGGSGGGIGSGKGVGVGNAKNFVGAFGGSFKRPNSLEGTLYDLKFGPTGRNLGADAAERIAQLQRAFETLDRNWSGAKAMLDSRYRQAELKLYASNIFIPPRNAAEATKAFECEKEIQAPGWLAYYEGSFAPPISGKYRFVGLGDDIMVVAVGGKTVLSTFWPNSKLNVTKFEPDWLPKNAGKTDGQGMLFPPHAGGRYAGEWLELRKGQAYRIQVAFGESYGGLFSAALLIEQQGVAYPKGRDTQLPIFMLEPLSPEEILLKQSNHIDHQTEGPLFGCEINGVTLRGAGR
jgi:hypothetical protein